MANSLYGVTAANFFSYYDPDLAEAITLTGQYCIKTAIRATDDYLNNKLGTVGIQFGTYADTDSVGFDTIIRVDGQEIKIGDFFESCSFQRIEKRGTDNYIKHVTDSDYYTFAFDGKGVVRKRINYVMAHKVKKELFKITVGDKSVTITEDHSLIVIRDGEMISVKPREVAPKDRVVKIVCDTFETSEEFVIESLGVNEEWVYDIEVEDVHNFFANDILVHNSVYVHVQKIVDKFCQGMSETQIVDFLEELVVKELQPLYDRVFEAELAKFGVTKSRMFLKLECIGPAAIWTAPKKYCFNILYSEGVRYQTPKTKVMGIEIVRSSTPTMVKPHLKKCIEIMLSGKEAELQKYIIEVKKIFFQQPYWEISFPRGVNGLKTYSSDTTIYAKGGGASTPIAVRGALLYNYHIKKADIDSKYPPIGEGDKCKFVYLKKPNPIHENVIAFPVKIPKEMGLEKYVDYNTQWDKTFLAPLDKLLAAMKWSAEPKNEAFDDCW